MDEQQIKDLIESLKKLSGSPREQQQKLRVEAERLVVGKKNVSEIKKVNAEINKRAKAEKVSEKTIKDFNVAVEDSIDAHREYEKSLKQVGSAVAGLGRAAFAGEGSISAFTDNLRGFNVIGDAIAGLGNRLDTNIETFRQLSAIGATFGQSIVDLRQTAATAALPLDDFAKLVADNSDSLAALFGSATQGAKSVALLGEAVRTQGIERLAPLGFTVDEINETLLLNLERQRRTNIFSRLTDQQRIQSAINFATELDRLAKLTGQQRDELRSAIEQQQSNERFQAFLQGATDETRRRLELFAGTIGNISPELAEGFQDLIANAGVPVTEAALELVQNVPQIRGVVTDLISGTTSAELALARTRDLSTLSVERFRKATVTGQVEFTRLQGGLINVGNRLVDVDAILAEQGTTADSLTSGLTTFEDATKRLSGQFQQIETGLLQAFGPALGGLSRGLQGIMGGFGGLAQALAGVPALTGTAIAGVLAGKFLFDKASQIGIIAAGTAIGFGKSGVLGRLGGAAGAVGRGATRVLPGLGAAVGIGSSAAMLADEDTRTQGLAGLGGAGIGAAIGTMILPGVGTLIGAGLGSAIGQGAGALFGGGRQFGGGMEAGTTYLTGERGPEIVTAGSSSTITSNADLKETFDTEALETKMSTMISELNAANKTLASMVNGVNTLVAVESRALKAVETTARKDRNQVGLV